MQTLRRLVEHELTWAGYTAAQLAVILTDHTALEAIADDPGGEAVDIVLRRADELFPNVGIAC